MRSFRGGGLAHQRPPARFLHPSPLKGRPCSIEGERGAEASEAASWMMQSAAKVFASERAAARLVVGFGCLPSSCNGLSSEGDGVVRGVLPAGRLLFEYMRLSGSDCSCLLVLKAPTPSPCCVRKAVRCSCETTKARRSPSAAVPWLPRQRLCDAPFMRSLSQELKFLETGFDKWLRFLLNMGFWLL